MASANDPDLDPRAMAEAMIRDCKRRRHAKNLSEKRQDLYAAYVGFLRGERSRDEMRRIVGKIHISFS